MCILYTLLSLLLSRRGGPVGMGAVLRVPQYLRYEHFLILLFDRSAAVTTNALYHWLRPRYAPRLTTGSNRSRPRWGPPAFLRTSGRRTPGFAGLRRTQLQPPPTSTRRCPGIPGGSEG